MALFNYASKEITLKVVYYGPGLCGKTTNIQSLHETMSPDKTGKLLSLSTDADRTLFFDFMPINLGKIKDFNIRFQLYTVPGQVRYNATRKLVLKGADAVVFVADSQTAMKDANIESLDNMKENLKANNIKFDEIPVVLQYNKRDLQNILSVDEMDKFLNPRKDQIIEASAYEGWGVQETFKLVTRRLMKYISTKHNIKIGPQDEEEEVTVSKPAPKAAPAPTPPPVAAAKPFKATISQSDIEDAILAAAAPQAPADQFAQVVEEAPADEGFGSWGDSPATEEAPAAAWEDEPIAAASPYEGSALDMTFDTGHHDDQPSQWADDAQAGSMDTWQNEADFSSDGAETAVEAETVAEEVSFGSDDMGFGDFGAGAVSSDTSELASLLDEPQAVVPPPPPPQRPAAPPVQARAPQVPPIPQRPAAAVPPPQMQRPAPAAPAAAGKDLTALKGLVGQLTQEYVSVKQRQAELQQSMSNIETLLKKIDTFLKT